MPDTDTQLLTKELCRVANPGGSPCSLPKGHAGGHDSTAYGPPDTELLTDQQIAEIESREYVVEGWSHFIKLRPDERDSLIATVKQLRLQLAEWELHRPGIIEAVQTAEQAESDAQSQLEQLRAENERLTKQLADIEEREAALCPEDVGFEEYIRTLETKLERLSK